MIYASVIILLITSTCFLWNLSKAYSKYVAYDLTTFFEEISANILATKGDVVQVMNSESITLQEIDSLIYMNNSLNYSIDTILSNKSNILFGAENERPQLVTYQIKNIYNSIKGEILESPSKVKISITESQKKDFSIILMILSDLSLIVTNDDQVSKNNFKEILNEIYTIQEHNYRNVNKSN